MYVITSKQDNVVAFITETLDHNEAKQPLITVNGGTIAVGFPINEYSNVTIPDGVEVQKYCYDGTTFTKNPNYPWPTLEEAKTKAIEESKTALAAWLSEHPLTYTDGKTYSVTQEKQNLLTGNLSAYQLAISLGQTNPELTWNATGEECAVWAFADLAALALAIKAYVKPRVSAQQTYEVAVNACTTPEAVEELSYDYNSVE